MNMTTEQIDQIFNGAGAVLNGVQAVSNVVGGAINEVQNAFGDSRRNQLPVNPIGQQGYQSLPSYGYGYSETIQYSPYGSFYQNGTQPQQNTNCYQGFTNPMYGTTGGPVPYQTFSGTSGLDFPKGGSWGW